MSSNQTPSNAQVVAYLRGNTESNRDEQLSAIRECAQSDGVTIARVYTDDGKIPNVREGLFRLLSDIEGGRINLVYVSSLDHLTRDVRQLQPIFLQLKRKNARLRTVDGLDPANPEHKFILGLLAAMFDENPIYSPACGTTVVEN
jgi:DNA invertase Pin-like site-specific DNA recombinase